MSGLDKAFSISMRVAFSVLAVSAALLTALTIGLIVVRASNGPTNAVLPAFGLVVTLNAIIHVLIALDCFLIGLAALIRRRLRER